MNAETKERAANITLALGSLYGLVALRYLFEDGSVGDVHFLQSLALGWAFAVCAVVVTIMPARVRPPHLRD